MIENRLANFNLNSSPIYPTKGVPVTPGLNKQRIFKNSIKFVERLASLHGLRTNIRAV